jgi:hypothetical protein
VLGLTIGGATVAVRSVRGRRGFATDRLHRPFLGTAGTPVLGLSVRPLDAVRPPSGVLRFDSGIGWQVWQTTHGWSLRFTDGRGRAPTLYQALEADRRWTRATLYMRRPHRAAGSEPFFLAHPLEQLLFMSLLTRVRGFVVHATGLTRDGVGWVFAGTHGAGKSTLARLATRRGDSLLLSDDRVVLRRVHGRWHVFGTPWSGTVREPTSPTSAPVRAVFFIRHGDETKAVELTAPEALRRLVPRCLHPYWDRAALGRLIDDAAHLVSTLPCYDFPFVPNASAIVLAAEILHR